MKDEKVVPRPKRTPMSFHGKMMTTTIADLVDLWIDYTHDMNRRNQPIVDSFERSYKETGKIPLPIDQKGNFISVEEPSFTGFMDWLAIRRYEAKQDEKE